MDLSMIVVEIGSSTASAGRPKNPPIAHVTHTDTLYRRPAGFCDTVPLSLETATLKALKSAALVASLTKPDNFFGIAPSSFSTGIPSAFATLTIQRGFSNALIACHSEVRSSGLNCASATTSASSQRDYFFQ